MARMWDFFHIHWIKTGKVAAFLEINNCVVSNKAM